MYTKHIAPSILEYEMNRKQIIAFTIIASLFIVSCVAQTPTFRETPSVKISNNVGYPVSETEGVDTGYPLFSQTAISLPTPTFNTSKAIAIATIYYDDTPLVNRDFFLASILQDSGGNETVGRIDRSEAPRGVSDINGTVTFYNVSPGRYALVLFEDLSSYLLLDPSNGEPIIFTLTEGEIQDLGRFTFTDLPIE